MILNCDVALSARFHYTLYELEVFFGFKVLIVEIFEDAF